jgi:hypothetical protein
MWSYYKRTFPAVQLFTLVICWMVFRTSNHQLGPTALFFVTMQASAFLGALWANRLRRKMTRSTSC